MSNSVAGSPERQDEFSFTTKLKDFGSKFKNKRGDKMKIHIDKEKLIKSGLSDVSVEIKSKDIGINHAFDASIL